MLHPEESPEKSQYNVAAPQFLDNPPPPSFCLPPPSPTPLLAKIFRFPLLISINFERVDQPPFMKGGWGGGGGGVRTMKNVKNY